MGKRNSLEWKHLFESEEFEKAYTYDGTDLGYTLNNESTCFKVWAPTADEVALNLYQSGEKDADDKIKTMPMQKADKGVWQIEVDEHLKNVYYTYTITANGETNETQDVYSKACGANGHRSMVADLSDTNPEGWQDDAYRYDVSCLPVIYELHVKDFSFAESSGIPKAFRGKYKAFTIDGTTLFGKGEKPTCMAYLKELGITHVHILPSYDFGSVDEVKDFDTTFNWGYDPENYNVPEGSYATDAADGLVRIREFKEMVQALHKAGIGVIMDVVYNHTYSTNSSFQRTVPYYYYRVNEDGSLSNGSICGNDTASERSMYRNFMVQSVCYWAKEYHIDGFRFDLMGLHDVETMNAIRAALDALPGGEHILMYGEPWAGGPTAMKEGSIQALKKNCTLLNERIAFFNDDTRDVIKGSVFYEEKPGFVNGSQKEGQALLLKSAVQAWCGGEGGYQPANPGQVISYVSAHDNWTLWDKLNYTLKENPDFKEKDEEILAANRFAAGIYFTCLGAVFFQAGEEAARTKLGEGDSFKSPPQLNALDWERMYQFEDLMTYYKGLIAMRRNCGQYMIRDEEAVESIHFYAADNGCVAFSVDAADTRDKYTRLWVVYARDVKNVQLPAAKRVVLCDGTHVLKKPTKVKNLKKVPICPNGVTIFGEEWDA